MKRYIGAIFDIIFIKVFSINLFSVVPFLLFCSLLFLFFAVIKTKYNYDRETLLIAEKKMIEIIEEKTTKKEEFDKMLKEGNPDFLELIQEILNYKKYVPYCLGEAQKEKQAQ